MLRPIYRWRVRSRIYRWRVRSRIYRWYGDLREIEQQISHDIDKDASVKLLARLVLLQEDVTTQAAPLPYTDELYQLRSHIALVYEKLDKHLVQKSNKRPRRLDGAIGTTSQS